MPATVESTSIGGGRTVELRAIEPADGDECARIIFEAFGGIHDHHRFARDFPTLEAAGQLTSAFISHPSIWGVVAELDGRIVGSNFLDERGPIRGLGPITVDPQAQGAGVGHRLMEAALERGREAAGIRLFQISRFVPSRRAISRSARTSASGCTASGGRTSCTMPSRPPSSRRSARSVTAV